MTNRYNPYCQFVVLYRVNDAATSLAQAVPFLSRQFFAAWRTWIIAKVFYTIQDFSNILFRDAGKILCDGFFEK